FLNFIPMPPMEGPPGDFIGALVKTGYLFKVLACTEVFCGALLLAGVFVPLALVVITPVLVNIVCFHVMLTPPKDWIGPIIFAALWALLVYAHRAAYAPMFRPRAPIG